MIQQSIRVAQSLVGGHTEDAKNRWTRWVQVAQFWRTDGTVISRTLPVDMQFESGTIHSVLDTQVSATTPLKPRVEVQPVAIGRRSPEEVERQRAVSTLRMCYLDTVFDRRDLASVLKKANLYGRTCGHAWLCADWDFERNLPRYVAESPLTVWADPEAFDDDDAAYVVRVKFLRSWEVAACVEKGWYKEEAKRFATQKKPEWMTLVQTPSKTDELWPGLVVYEIWDFIEERVYHFCPDAQTFLLIEPLPNQILRRPFYRILFSDDLGSTQGIATGEVLLAPAKIKSLLQTLHLQHLRTSMPDRWLDRSGIEDVEKLLEELQRPSEPGTTRVIALKGEKTLKDVMWTDPAVNLPNTFGQFNIDLDADMLQRAALPSYERGGEGPKVATVAALQQAASMTRRAWDIATMMKAVTWCGLAGIQLAEEYHPRDRSVRIAMRGDAGQVDHVITVERTALDFRDPAVIAEAIAQGWDPATSDLYTYSAAPYDDPVNANPQAEYATLNAMYEAELARKAAGQPGYFSLSWLADQIAQLMRLPAEAREDPPPPAPAAPPGLPGAPGLPPPAAPPAPLPAADPLLAGGLPPTAPALPTPALAGMAGGAGFPAPAPGVPTP